MTATQLKIQEVLEKLVESKKIETHYDQTLDRLQEAYDKLDELHDILQKEYKDVQELESLNLKSLFKKVLGSREEQIQKERQEYLQASLKYNDFKKSVELLEYERDLLKKKLTDGDILNKELKKLKEKRKNELLNSGSMEGKELISIVKDLDRIISYKGELNNALDTGHKCEQHLKRLVHYLETAGEWGKWDMAGGGRHASFNKMNAIDKAREASYHVKHHLAKFQQDLYNIGGQRYNLDINIGSFNRFTDVFFDNLISDWIIQQKINNALNNIRGVNDTVIRLMQGLQAEIQSKNAKAIDLNVRKNEILLSK